MSLARTNMTPEEMVPETDNPTHDARFWCLPPVRDSPSEDGHQGGNFPMYLVSQGAKVGIWYNWTAVKAVVDGYPSGSQRGHQTLQGCVREWQIHCALGVHPHLADPQIRGPSSHSAQGEEAGMPNIAALDLGTGSASSATSASNAWSASSATSSVLSLSPSVASLSLTCITTTTDTARALRPTDGGSGTGGMARYFAIWGSRVVYTDRDEAKAAFLASEADGLKPRLLATSNYDEGEAFAGGVYWVDD
ncbi:hypothetical protein C8F04DRAFT_1253700 [Mycena alexandri]|uniref:Uncharacterized protein n=1 Tax=Mycena alexandri TaxID=1745969 RepID=A0AAD6T7B5_9AGAR|nr:hypothetical protein C8F04DRAFT_1253700 [Mycena alexandri]